MQQEAGTLFVLVNPPFVAICRPNLGLSLLKATLTRDGHPARICYADHILAARLGPDAYASVHDIHHWMIGEWLFSGFVRRQGDWDPRFIEDLRSKGVAPWQIDTLWYWTIVELGDYLKTMARGLLAMNPTVVGCSSTFQQNNASLAILREVKKLNPKVVTVMGGANLEGELGMPVVDYPWVDFILAGEAEGCISRFYSLCRQYGKDIPASELPPEVTATSGAVPLRGKVENMDALPYPDFSDYFASLAAYPILASVEAHLTLEGSRGCWWGQVNHCTFCGLNGSGMNYRAKGPQRLLGEIMGLSQAQGMKRIEMVDNIIAPKHLQELMPELARTEHNLQFFWEVKANLKSAHFEMLRQAGVVWLQPGIESLSDNVLALMRKGQRVTQNLLVLKAAREHGIRLSWNILLGHPGETAEDIRQQEALVHHIVHFQPPKVIGQVRIDRFSPLFAELPQIRPFDVYSQIYDLEPSEVRKLAYYFQVDDQVGPPVEYSAMSRLLEEAVARWQNSYAEDPHRHQLYFGDEPFSVIDGRGNGEPLLIALSKKDYQLLASCDQPLRLLEAEKRLGPLEESICRLVELGLCYRDETNILSLVLSRQTAQLPAMLAPWKLY